MTATPRRPGHRRPAAASASASPQALADGRLRHRHHRHRRPGRGEARRSDAAAAARRRGAPICRPTSRPRRPSADWSSRASSDFGRIDCLVNNAGMASVVRGDLLDLAPANFDRVMAINLRGTVFLTQAVVKAMLRQPRADGPRSIINITSCQRRA